MDPSSEMSSPQDIMRFLVTTDELVATKELLDHADRLLDGFENVDRDWHVLTVVLATGAEKLLKLTYGLLLTHVEGVWPRERLRGFGHGIVKMDDECRDQIMARVDSTKHAALQQTYDAMQQDRWLSDLLTILDNYARGGRFFNLDWLGAREDLRKSPRDGWVELHFRAWEGSRLDRVTDPTAATTPGLRALGIQTVVAPVA